MSGCAPAARGAPASAPAGLRTRIAAARVAWREVPLLLRKIVGGITLALLVIDLGATIFLLWIMDVALALGLPLALAVVVFTGYELQWRYLLSPQAYRAAGSKARFLAAAGVILAVNVGATYLLSLGFWTAYLGVRVIAAGLGAYAWTRWRLRALAAPATGA